MSKSDTSSRGTTERPLPELYYRTATGRPATDLVLGHIMDAVIAGDLLPGGRLNANKLSETLDVSVVPVREAIHFLAGEGVIELLPLKGARIRKMNAGEMVDWWHIFRVISELGFRAAATSIADEPDQADRISNALARIKAAEKKQPPVRYILSLADFHRVVNDIGGKPVLDEATRRMQVLFWCSFLPDFVPFDIYGRYFTEHYCLVGEAIMRGDGDTAVSVFKHHVDWSSSIIQGERPVPGAPWAAPDRHGDNKE